MKISLFFILLFCSLFLFGCEQQDPTKEANKFVAEVKKQMKENTQLNISAPKKKTQKPKPPILASPASSNIILIGTLISTKQQAAFLKINDEIKKTTIGAIIANTKVANISESSVKLTQLKTHKTILLHITE